jgi:hypothetical protein
MPAADGARPSPHAAPTPPARVTAPPPPRKAFPTVPLEIAPTPVMIPHAGDAAPHARPSLGDWAAEVDDEALKKSFARPVTHPGAVLCRFCKVPLDMAAEYCNHCGAPIAEAAPPGALKPQSQAGVPPARFDEVLLSPPDKPPEASPVQPPTGSASEDHAGASPPPAAEPIADTEPTPPTPPLTPPADDHRSGLIGRLKRLFRRG